MELNIEEEKQLLDKIIKEKQNIIDICKETEKYSKILEERRINQTIFVIGETPESYTQKSSELAGEKEIQQKFKEQKYQEICKDIECFKETIMKKIKSMLENMSTDNMFDTDIKTAEDLRYFYMRLVGIDFSNVENLKNEIYFSNSEILEEEQVI